MSIFRRDAMATLKIPESEYVVLRKIAELKDSSFVEFLKAVAESDTSILYFDFSERLATKVSSLTASEMKPMLKTASNLYAIMYRRGKSLEDLGNDIKETVIGSKLFPAEMADLLKERIQKLLSLDKVIGLVAKAFDVMTDQDRLFCSVKVLSDIRPVFTESADSISAAVVVHNLRIGYHQDGEHTEFSVAMNTDDVRATLKAMERAERKAATLKSFIQKSGIPYFEDKE